MGDVSFGPGETLLLKAQAALCRGKGSKDINGTLFVTDSNIFWKADVVGLDQTLCLRGGDILKYFLARAKNMMKVDLKKKKGSAGRTSYIFKFTSRNSRVLNDANKSVTRLLKWRGRGKISAAAKIEAAAYTSEKKQPEEASEDSKLKQALLSKDKHLRDRYTSFVKGGIISADEFWQNCSELLEKARTATARTEQLEEGVEYELDASRIRDIFTEEPDVYKDYRRLVPVKMSEAFFWHQYFVHKHNKRSHGVGKRKGKKKKKKKKKKKNDDDRVYINTTTGRLLPVVPRSVLTACCD